MSLCPLVTLRYSSPQVPRSTCLDCAMRANWAPVPAPSLWKASTSKVKLALDLHGKEPSSPQIIWAAAENNAQTWLGVEAAPTSPGALPRT